MKRLKEFRGLSDEDLKKRIYEARLELSKDKGASEIGTVKNPGRIRSLKRDIARMLTIQRAAVMNEHKALQKQRPVRSQSQTVKKEVKK